MVGVFGHQRGRVSSFYNFEGKVIKGYFSLEKMFYSKRLSLWGEL